MFIKIVQINVKQELNTYYSQVKSDIIFILSFIITGITTTIFII